MVTVRFKLGESQRVLNLTVWPARARATSPT